MTEEKPESLGLRTLEDISGIILHSHDLQETLDNIVTLVAKRVGSDVCSIYLLEADGETLVLKATKGLSKASVGTVTMKTSEGLTGLVIEQRGVVNIGNAPLHPRYKYFRKAREEKFHSFLGLPLFERKTPLGVVVIQTREPRTFTPAEISAISTIAYQISSIVVNARLLDSIRKKEEERAFFERELERMKSSGVIRDDRQERARKKIRTPVMLSGTAASPGFCRGRIYLLDQKGVREGDGLEQVLPRAEELKRFQIALEKAKIQTLYMEKRVAELVSKENAAIFHTHLMILEDRGFINRVIEYLDRDYGTNRAVRETVEYYVSAFNRMDDPYLRERSADMEDIGRRIIDCLDGNERSRIRMREKRIIASSDILPSDMATLDHDKILGIVTEKGDVNSHAAIMARSLGIPAVLGVGDLLHNLSLRDEVIIDGTSGVVYVNPDALVKDEYERLQRDYSQKQRAWEELRDLAAETRDGFKVTLKANIGLLSDIRVALANGAEGVGLYRTEFPFMTRKSFPDRYEQASIYRRILEGFEGMPVTIRTLDIGGDKGLPYFAYPREDNPFMGWRSIRVSLDRQDIFREQLAGILLASPYGKASIMFPMVSGIDEIRTIKALIADVQSELTRAGHDFDPDMRFGIMVELPAAVLTAPILIREVDFFSIGTNDLIQYTLAADRNNAKVKQYYDACHPAVLHAIKRVADTARDAGKGVSLCGEMAADPVTAILLLGLGIADFSLAAPYIPAVKEALRLVTRSDAEALATHVLHLDSAAEIRRYLETMKLKLKR
jgi:phosphotransferase system enzyme I (PtsP)